MIKKAAGKRSGQEGDLRGLMKKCNGAERREGRGLHFKSPKKNLSKARGEVANNGRQTKEQGGCVADTKKTLFWTDKEKRGASGNRGKTFLPSLDLKSERRSTKGGKKRETRVFRERKGKKT